MEIAHEPLPDHWAGADRRQWWPHQRAHALENPEAHGGKLPADVRAFFQNTRKEREETLVFIDAMAKHWGVNIVWMEWCRVYGQPDDAPWYKIVDFETASLSR